jgi:hypothetical protein
MSKYNNVNPGQYHTAGRLRMGERTTQAADRQAHAASKQAATSKPARRPAPSRATRASSSSGPARRPR